MAALPDPVVDDEVREELKLAMKETGAPAELVDAIGTIKVGDLTAQVDDQPRSIRKPRRRKRSH
jgi:hypothetical protein